MTVLGFAGDQATLRYAQRELVNVKMVLRHVRVLDVAVQAGGGLGVFPRFLSSLFRTVYTFEPDPEQFALMTANAPEPNIIRFQAALGNGPCMVKPVCERRDGKSARPHPGITHVEPGGVVPTLKLDALGLPTCNLIYLDIEGREWWAINGATATIMRCRPVLVCEINHHTEAEGKHPEELRGYIQALGYMFVERLGNDEVFVPVGARL